jgi:microcystin-dependent protein
MAEFTGLTLTNIGYALQIKAQAGTELKFTRVALGAGVLPPGTLLNTLTALNNEKQTAAISNLVVGGKSVQIKVNFSNKNLTENYYLRELGIFANDPDKGEILYAVANAGNAADYMPAYDGAEAIEQVFTIELSVGNAANVTATFAESIYVLKAGDTMTGALTLSGDPTANLHAATKQYVDSENTANDPLGVVKEYYGTTLPARHLWVDGKTIGDAGSGATALTSSDAFALFTVLWNAANATGSQIWLYDSSGTAITKGESATVDFEAHKRLSLPDKRGRVAVGLDSMGGTSANVVTNNNADILGGTGGEENHTQTAAENGPHRHKLISNLGGGGTLTQSNFISLGYNPENFDNFKPGLAGVGGEATYGLSSQEGSGTAHNNMQPWIACNYIMRY